ncbi:MAG: NAD-dependent epimerase/dehydratase family protein, partial [Ignavibacteriota bacterium]
MKVLIFGATGMVGQGVLRECLLDPGVEQVTSIGRRGSGASHPKLRELVRSDLWNYTSIEPELTGFDACFFCLGVTSAGMREADYEHITYGIAAAAAETLARLDPQMTFIFVSGAGSDSSEKGRVMWARIKGKAENAVLGQPFKGAYVFRPGVIEPRHGIQSRTTAYRVGYVLMKPLMPLLRWAFPGQILNTEQIGRAMLRVARSGAPKRVLESKDISAL